MLYFSLEDYFYNITPVRRWGFFFFLLFSGSAYFCSSYSDLKGKQNIIKQQEYQQAETIKNLKSILAAKNKNINLRTFIIDNFDVKEMSPENIIFSLQFDSLIDFLDQLKNSNLCFNSLQVSGIDQQVLVSIAIPKQNGKTF